MKGFIRQNQLFGNADAQRKKCFCRRIAAGCGGKEKYRLEAAKEKVRIRVENGILNLGGLFI